MLAVVILVHGVYAAPVPHVVTKADLRSPVSRNEVRIWAKRLTSWGYAITPQELGEQVRRVTGVIGGAHRAAKAPFRPWMRVTGTGQGWGLFANPDTHPVRLEIWVRRGDDAEPELLYRQLDAHAAWRAPVVRFRRVRGVWDHGRHSVRPRATFLRFADWVSGEIFDELPDVDWVELRGVRTHTTPYGVPDDPEVEILHAVERRRGP